jgi:hypothetical protein
MAPGITAWGDDSHHETHKDLNHDNELTSTSIRRTSTTMKSTAAAFVEISSYSLSSDMLGERECGSGNDRAQAGVGFLSVSIKVEDEDVYPR